MIVQMRSIFSGRMPSQLKTTSMSPTISQITQVTPLIIHRISVPRMGIISKSSMIKAIAERTHPSMDSNVTRTAFTTVVITSHNTEAAVVTQVHATQTIFETQVHATQTILETQTHASQAQLHGHQSQHSLYP